MQVQVQSRLRAKEMMLQTMSATGGFRQNSYRAGVVTRAVISEHNDRSADNVALARRRIELELQTSGVNLHDRKANVKSPCKGKLKEPSVGGGGSEFRLCAGDLCRMEMTCNV